MNKPSLAGIDKRLSILEATVDRNFASLKTWLEERFDKMETRQGYIENKQDSLHLRLDQVEDEVSQMRPWVGGLSKAFWVLMTAMLLAGLGALWWAAAKAGVQIP